MPVRRDGDICTCHDVAHVSKGKETIKTIIALEGSLITMSRKLRQRMPSTWVRAKLQKSYDIVGTCHLLCGKMPQPSLCPLYFSQQNPPFVYFLSYSPPCLVSPLRPCQKIRKIYILTITRRNNPQETNSIGQELRLVNQQINYF